MRPVPFAAFSFTHWPTNYRTVTQRFRANPENYLPYGLPGHEGVDIRAPHGTPVYAVAGGMVSDIHLPPTGHNYGTFVRVRHADDYETTYAHLLSVGVKLGQQVVGGQQIGTADNTGNSFGAHLHLTLKKLGQTFTDHCGNVWPYQIHDPEPFLLPFAGVAWPPAVPCQQPGQIDMSVYFYPPGGSTRSDIFTLSNNWGQGPERCQLQRVGNVSYVTKNQQYEKRTVGNVAIALNLDTSPGNGEYYTVESPTGWMPRMWQPGQTFTRQETTRFFRKSDCGFLRQSNWSTPLTFERIHATWTSQAGITLVNVAELSWFANGRIDERYWFAAGLGLVAWEKYTGQRSWISELIPRGSQQDNVRETGCFG